MVIREPCDDKLPALPLAAAHWRAVFAEMGLSPRQSEIAALLARGAPLKQIALLLGIAIPTIRTQQDRIFTKVGVRSRSEFLLQILAVSHRVDDCRCRHK